MAFPVHRPRRLRSSALLRDMVRETKLSPADFVYPVFICPGDGVKREIQAMPDNFQMSVDQIVAECREAASLGIPAVLLFGLPESKDDEASSAWAEDGIVQRAIREIKATVNDLLVIADCCLCEYTSHGHCGRIVDQDVDNDSTLELLSKTALSQAKAGADIIAPSDMMDGRVGAIRKTLDENALSNTAIMSYAAKYASCFYGPFREAAESAPQFGDRRSYQMDPANQCEALREIALDVEEGADIIMVKPALPFLDVICLAKQQFELPVAAYQVSGEYAMIVAAGQRGWIDQERAMIESITSIKRAGADLIITYFAKKMAQLV